MPTWETKHVPILIAGIIALAFIAMAAAAVSQGQFPEATAAPVPAVAPGAGRARAKSSRCPACGVIESIRTVAPAGGLPATYEITVRLRDGSKGVHRDASPANWRIGESVQFLGGEDTAAR